MADKVRYSISVTPIETVTLVVQYNGEEQTGVLPADVSDGTHEVIATEINTIINGIS